ncbi:hypothetical protein L1987_80992 [Smallanthus sonchifolius]|uniref:Uncharacterized protein n=1 Tax=Smallanthus sonchifolius TaxID=185202 RepID=A0ACB8YPF2_9ASTR|nr:hypothetical protein L1987_80992 [Smallanthus sonchifolius]
MAGEQVSVIVSPHEEDVGEIEMAGEQRKAAGNDIEMPASKIGCAMGYCCWLYIKRKGAGNDIVMPASKIGCAMFTLHKLEEATNGFNENNVLGSCGYGVVYRGQFRDGKLIAVKRMNSLENGAGNDIEMYASKIGCAMFMLHEFEEVSNGFSEDNVLGSGGYGVVYRG